MIETDAELWELPVGTVVRAADGTIAGRFDDERGVLFGDERPFPWNLLRAPAVVLYQEALPMWFDLFGRERRDLIDDLADHRRLNSRSRDQLTAFEKMRAAIVLEHQPGLHPTRDWVHLVIRCRCCRNPDGEALPWPCPTIEAVLVTAAQEET